VPEKPLPTFEVIGDLSDEAIEALAGFLLSFRDQDEQAPAGEEDCSTPEASK